MKMRPLPSRAELLRLLRYDPETGKLFWRERPRDGFKTLRAYNTWNSRFTNKEAFTAAMEAGYRLGAINEVLYYAHRIIFKMVHDIEPLQIDHGNGNRSDNRLSNLSASSDAGNRLNMCLRSDNISGYHGVSWSNRDCSLEARITYQGHNVYLGYFKRKSEAIKVRKVAEAKYEFHENHGRLA